MSWLSEISKDLSRLPSFFDYFEGQLEQAKYEVSIRGVVEANLSTLPGITEHRFNQLQDIESVLKHLEIQLRAIRTKHFQTYLEKYNRTLTSRDAEKYVDGEAEVIAQEQLINEVALLRNKFSGIMKGLESKNFMLGHLTKLKCAGMEDFSL